MKIIVIGLSLVKLQLFQKTQPHPQNQMYITKPFSLLSNFLLKKTFYSKTFIIIIIITATRARNIQNRPMIQMDPKEQLIFNLRQEAKLLRLENEFLRQQLAAHNGGVVPPRLYSRQSSAR